MIHDTEKYIDIFQELENNLLNHQNIIYKYIGFLLLPQIIESRNDFNKVEIFIKICFNNFTNQNCQIRYGVSYSINYFISNFGDNFYTKYSYEFLQLIIQSIKNENNFHTKCEMILVFNCFISYLNNDEENNNNNTISINGSNAKEFLLKNFNDILKLLISEFDNCIKIEKDSEKCLIKNELLKSLIYCHQLFSDKCKSYSKDIIIYLSKYLNNIYNKKINTHLYINLIHVISLYSKYDDNNNILNLLDLLYNCFQEILKNINNYMNQINNIHPLILDFLPIINSNKPQFIPTIINDLINILNSLIGEINENDVSHIDDIYNLLNIINSSIQIIDEKCINYLTEIENCFEKILNKIKNISKINNIIGEILTNIIQILSKINNHKNLKNKGKNYLEIIFNIIKHEYNSEKTLLLVDNLNKIFENIVNYLNQNELEQVFNGTIQLIEFFENKISALLYKKNKTENEIEMETEDLSISSEDYEENSEKEIIEMLEENIDNLEQVNENLSSVIENMMKYSSKKKLKNINECLYNKVIPSLINLNNSNNANSNSIKIAINFIDDLIEYLDFNKFTSHILGDLINLLIKYSKNGKSDIRQAANYGLGIFIKLSEKNIYEKYCDEILKALKVSCINFPSNNSMNKKIYRANGLAYDNAIAAIGKAIGYKKIKEIEYIYFWIDNLPLNIDETEMEEGHIILCDFIINNIYKEYNIKENYLNKVINIFINIYKEENKSNQEINDKIKLIFKNNNELRLIIEKIYNEYKNENENNVNKSKIEIIIK